MIEVQTLEPGGQTAVEMARRVAGFLGEARSSLDLALYDLRLPDQPGDIVAGALRAAATRGVVVRIAYNADHDERVFPPPPRTKPDLLEALPFPTVGIPGVPDLMHHKYAVRDGAAVWTGSTNWTTDSWTRQENLVVTASSAELAGEFVGAGEKSQLLGEIVARLVQAGVRPQRPLYAGRVASASPPPWSAAVSAARRASRTRSGATFPSPIEST